MKLAQLLLLAGLAASLSGAAAANQAESGMLALYADQYIGSPTASGEIYDGRALTAAHSSLPFGAMVRVAHFGTGKMVDVRINDRKARDARLLHLSHSAGQILGIGSNQTVQGSMMVVGTAPATIPLSAQSSPVVSNPPIPAPEGQVAQQPFRPFADFQQQAALKKAVNNPNAAVAVPNPGYAPSQVQAPVKRGLFGKPKPVQYGIPSQQYQPPVGQTGVAPAGKQGGFFAGLFNGKSQQAAVPQPNGNLPGAVIPMSAPSANGAPAIHPPSQPQPTMQVPQRPVVQAPPAAPANVAPYRVQFGAYTKYQNAQEMAQVLNQSGVRTVVAPANGRPLHLVITEGGFPTADQAQNWINYEAARRGWRDRPVVIR
ncbi:MAG: RlpA-like double-psi beta-barrel domain-containing protein [Verrucomicrobiales bacterium]|nr:RlpA-like double-psi beta-barrel domain-containing protein [Verrucomicrobiales bacterium]